MRQAGEAKRLCLVDGSGVLFRAYHALPGLRTSSGRPTGAIYGFAGMLLKLRREHPADHIAVVVDAPGGSFRQQIDPAYKANRESMPDDLRAQIPYIKRIVGALGLPLIEIAGVEADDVIATLAGQAVARDYAVQIVTSDKDLMQLVGPEVRLVDTMNDRTTGPDEVRERFGVPPENVPDVLGLMGDAVDNIPGVRGIGEKTARRLMEHFGSIDALYSRLDEIDGLGLRGAARIRQQLEGGEADARRSRELATVRRDVEVGVAIEALAAGEPDRAEIAVLASELEFARLLDAAGTAATAGAPSEAPPPPETVFMRVDATRLETWIDEEPPLALAVALAGERTPAALALARTGSDGGVEVCLAPIAPDADILRRILSGHLRARIWVEDLKSLLRACGVGLDRPLEGLGAGEVCDASLASYLVDSSRRAHDLEAACRLRGLEPPAGSADDPETWAASRAAALLRLGTRLADELGGGPLRTLFVEVEIPLARVLAGMEARGILVDPHVLEELGTEFGREVARLEARIHELAGGPFNVQSNVQLRDVLFARLGLPTQGVKRGKTGLSVDAEVLGRLAEEHEIVRCILEHRSLAKLISTYVNGLLELIAHGGTRIHTSFNQTVAATGRLSSSDPNLQNIPVRTAEGRRIRTAFVIPQGRALLSADYSQIELRLLAHLTGDPVLVEAFRTGEDIHIRTAAEVFGVSLGQVTPEMRRRAKVVNFGILYGMGAQRLAREFGIAVKEAEGIIARYFERYASVRAYSERIISEARERGWVETIYGRKRPLPDLATRQPVLRQAAERMAWNTPIQGAAADLIKLAMLAVERSLARRGGTARLLLQVHDELVLEVETPEIAEIGALVRRDMEGVAALAVPLVVDLRSGPNWADLH